MQNTPNYNYNLPEYSDSADIAVLNANFSSIDANEYRIEGKLNALGNDIALPYDNTATYSVGDYVIYNNALYRCITAIATAEDFDSTKWTVITIGGELKSHDTRISTLEAGVDLEKSATNSFDDGIDSYFKKVVSSIVPVQAGSGTPSPKNVRAISGFTECTVTDNGKNLLNNTANTTTSNNVTFTVNSDKTVLVNTNPSASALTQITLASITFKKGVTYTLSGCPSGGGGSSYALYVVGVIGVFPQAIDNGSGVTFTPNADVTTSINIIVYNGATVSNKTFSPMLRLASDIDNTYSPYVAPNTATISFGSVGTVYGGKVGLTTGVMTVTYGYVDLGSLTWSYANGVFNSSQITNLLVPSNDIICSNYPTIPYNVTSANMPDKSIKSYGASGNNIVYIKDTDYTDATTFKTAMNGVQLVYKLATPQTYQLTPAQLRSLVGTNNLTSNTGDTVEVEYITNKTIAWLLDLIRAQEV